jgi:dihydroorotate dehydrogenase
MFKFLYKKIIKPILFKFSADDVHHLFLKMGYFLGKNNISLFFCKKIFYFKDKSLNQKILGIDFENPIGLAAGFDYDADLINILPSVGFGFETIGTVTALPYSGNPRPMLGRLPKSKSLLVNKGFKNSGIDSILKKVSSSRKKIPLGISIGSTNKPFCSLDEMIDDIYISFSKAIDSNFFDYYELNISCPNLSNVEKIEEGIDTYKGLSSLLEKLSKLSFDRPVFIKMHLEKSIENTLSLIEASSEFSFVSGFIFSNLAKNRENKDFDKNEILRAGKGNFSGKPTEKMSNVLISAIYRRFKRRFIIIGCGGVFNGKDAYEKIKRGASLVQMITGMIYEGPSQIKNINKELVYLLKKDGYKNISEAIGTHRDSK